MTAELYFKTTFKLIRKATKVVAGTQRKICLLIRTSQVCRLIKLQNLHSV